ncbi:CheY-like chemotaxis protein [Bradyrhizobium sp. GM7.3]
MPAGSILVADDDTAIRTVLNQALSRAGYEVRLTGNAATLWRWVSQGEGDLVITDVVMPDENAFDLLPRIKKMRPNLPVIVMSAQNTFMTAIRASERGAYEYLPKPFDLKELIAIVGRALAEPKERVSTPNEDAEMEAIPLVGRSPAMQEIYRVLARLMQTDLTVMITGESGTGKELVARALHDYGKRRNGPFVAVNMAAIPRDLIESELFGHERGAFTGANTRASGRFEQAEGGTLFLDEIGDMPMEAQTRLLRVLQQGEYTTVGGRTPIKTDVRIVAASNKESARPDPARPVPRRSVLPPQRRAATAAAVARAHRRSARSHPSFLRAGGEGRPAAEKARHAGAGADEAAPLAGQRARAREPRPSPRGAVSPGCDHGLRHRRRAGATHGQPGCRRPAWRRQSRWRRGGVSLLALPGLPERRAAAGPLSSHLEGDRGATAHGRARGHPRQPDPRRRSARPQPQHAAEEDPGSRYPGVSERRLAPRNGRWLSSPYQAELSLSDRAGRRG